MKRILTMFLVLLLFIPLNGCRETKPVNTPAAVTPSPSSSDSGSVQKEITLVKKQNKTKYLLSNGIEINSLKKTVQNPNTALDFSFPQISGLVDKGLEKKLNESILSDMEAALKNYLSESKTDPQSLYLYFDVGLNANNLLSVSIFSYFYTYSENHPQPPLFGFLYRLTDGQRLYLKDIFTAGTDYIPLINGKVIESIAGNEGGEREENDILMAPFSTIKPDQAFYLTSSRLYIIFNAGESGFAARGAVPIPLSKIDDYVDVTDRYSGTERKTQLNTDLIVRANNIFTSEKGEIIKKADYKIWTHYTEISGLRDTAFETTVNSTIKNAVYEVVNDPKLEGLIKENNSGTTPTIVVSMEISFNHYGLLCLYRNVYVLDNGSSQFQNYNSVYSFDLLKKKQVDAKNLLNEYITKNKGMADTFASLAKGSLESQNNPELNDFINEINYSFIMDKGLIYFDKPSTASETEIIILFQPGTVKNFSNPVRSTISLKDIVKGAPEDFFGW